MTQLSHDDSFVTLLSKEAGLDANALNNHPMRHVLTSVVGAKLNLEVTGHELDIEDGHMLMLCSDGLYGALPPERLHEILIADRDLERVTDRLIQTAVATGASDNVSVLLARYAADSSS